NFTTETLLAIVCADLLLLFLLQKFGHETAPLLVNPDLQKEVVRKSIGAVLMEQLKNYKIIFKDKIFFLYIVAGIIVS
ncbi:MFS transporter, partial [Listeria monocytogenes]